MSQTMSTPSSEAFFRPTVCPPAPCSNCRSLGMFDAERRAAMCTHWHACGCSVHDRGDQTSTRRTIKNVTAAPLPLSPIRHGPILKACSRSLDYEVLCEKIICQAAGFMIGSQRGQPRTGRSNGRMMAAIICIVHRVAVNSKQMVT